LLQQQQQFLQQQQGMQATEEMRAFRGAAVSAVNCFIVNYFLKFIRQLNPLSKFKAIKKHS